MIASADDESAALLAASFSFLRCAVMMPSLSAHCTDRLGLARFVAAAEGSSLNSLAESDAGIEPSMSSLPLDLVNLVAE